MVEVIPEKDLTKGKEGYVKWSVWTVRPSLPGQEKTPITYLIQVAADVEIDGMDLEIFMHLKSASHGLKVYTNKEEALAAAKAFALKLNKHICYMKG
jgi:hypothetical protein